MSLKGFHIVFIVLSILLLAGFTVWAFNQYSIEHNINFLLTAIGLCICAAALVVYEFNFIKNVKG